VNRRAPDPVNQGSPEAGAVRGEDIDRCLDLSRRRLIFARQRKEPIGDLIGEQD
jgi:hypothetical protein